MNKGSVRHPGIKSVEFTLFPIVVCVKLVTETVVGKPRWVGFTKLVITASIVALVQVIALGTALHVLVNGAPHNFDSINELELWLNYFQCAHGSVMIMTSHHECMNVLMCNPQKSVSLFKPRVESGVLSLIFAKWRLYLYRGEKEWKFHDNNIIIVKQLWNTVNKKIMMYRRCWFSIQFRNNCVKSKVALVFCRST